MNYTYKLNNSEKDLLVELLAQASQIESDLEVIGNILDTITYIAKTPNGYCFPTVTQIERDKLHELLIIFAVSNYNDKSEQITSLLGNLTLQESNDQIKNKGESIKTPKMTVGCSDAFGE